ncbi:MAG: hypothetical protein WBE18_07450, partial [Gammaproteobacteria bacterium]
IIMNWQTTHPYLHAMGIPLWHMRKTLAYRCYALGDAQGITRGGLLVDNSVDINGYQDEVESLLDAMLQAIHVRRYLLPQVTEFSFAMYLVMGEALAQFIAQSSAPLTELREQVLYLTGKQIPVIATYHPIDLLRQPANKRNAWLDLQQAARLWASANG